MNIKSIPWYVWLVPIIMLLIATAPLPYGYYTFTRLVVCAFGSWIAFANWNETTPAARAWSIVLALIALLFNPIIPFHLNRSTWFYLDSGAAAIIGAHLVLVRLRGTKEAVS